MKKSRKKAPGLRLFLAALLVILVAVIIAVLVKSGGKINLSYLKNAFSGNDSVEFQYTAGEHMVFAELDGGLLTASSTGAYIFDLGGEEIARETFVMSNPAVHTSGNYAAVYDPGGKSLRVFDPKDEKYNILSENSITSAKINGDGWVALCTQEAGYKGAVTVYNESGNAVYVWHSGEGYPAAAAVSPDSKMLAVLTYTSEGSRFVFIKLNSEDEYASCTINDTVVIDMEYTTDSVLTAISPDGLYSIRENGEFSKTADFEGRYLNAYIITSDVSVISLRSYHASTSSSLISYDCDGDILGSADVGEQIIALSAGGGTISVLCGSGLNIYTNSMSLSSEWPEASGSTSLLTRSDGAVLAVGPRNAKVYK